MGGRIVIGVDLVGLFVPPQYRIAAKVIVTAVMIAVLVGFGFGWGYKSAYVKWELATSKVKEEASTRLQEATDEALRKENLYRQEAQKDEIEYYEAIEKIKKLQSDKSSLVASKRLYDPGRRKHCPNTVPNGNGAVVPLDRTEPDLSELSGAAERFLQEESIRADSAIQECNQFKQSAHKWAIGLAARQTRPSGGGNGIYGK